LSAQCAFRHRQAAKSEAESLTEEAALTLPGARRLFFKDRADSIPIINQSESVLLAKLLDCRLSIVHVYRPKPLQVLLVNGAVSPSVSLYLFVDLFRKSFHILRGERLLRFGKIRKLIKPFQRPWISTSKRF
jgi:hypothetical protein